MNDEIYTHGRVKVFVNDVRIIREILVREGFVDPSPFQTWREGQVFGLTKKVGKDLEMHVRGYEDFTVDSEVELSREYLEHPYDCKPFYGPLLEILHRYGIPFTITRPLPKDPHSVAVPKRKTPWKPLVAVGATLVATIGLVWLASKLKEKNDDEDLQEV